MEQAERPVHDQTGLENSRHRNCLLRKLLERAKAGGALDLETALS